MPREETLGQFLYELPSRDLSREERIEQIREALKDGEKVTQEDLDHVLVKLLEEIQREE